MMRIARCASSSFLESISTRTVRLEERLERKELCLVPLLLFVLHLKSKCVFIALEFLRYGSRVEACGALALAALSWWTTASQVKAYIERYVKQRLRRQLAALATFAVILILPSITSTAFLDHSCTMLTSATAHYVNGSANCRHFMTPRDFSEGSRILYWSGEPLEIPAERPHVFKCCSLSATVVAWLYIHALSMITRAILQGMSRMQQRRIESLDWAAKRLCVLDIWLVWQICEIVAKILITPCMSTQLRQLRQNALRTKARAAAFKEDTAAGIFMFVSTSDLLQLLSFAPGKTCACIHPQWHRALLRTIRQRSPLTLTVSRTFPRRQSGEVRDRAGQLVAKLANAGECQRSPLFNNISALELSVSITVDKRLIDWNSFETFLRMPKLSSVTVTATNDDSAGVCLPSQGQLAYTLLDSAELANRLAQLGRKLTSLHLLTEFRIAEPSIPRTLAIIPRLANLETLQTSVRRFLEITALSANRTSLVKLRTLSLLEGADGPNAEMPTHALAAFIVNRCGNLRCLSIPLAGCNSKEALTVAEFFAMLRAIAKLNVLNLLILRSTGLTIPQNEPVSTVRNLSIKTRDVTGVILQQVVGQFEGLQRLEVTTALDLLWPLLTSFSPHLRCLSLASFGGCSVGFISSQRVRDILQALDCPEVFLSKALRPAFFESAEELAEIWNLLSTTRVRSATIAGALRASSLAELQQRKERFAFSWIAVAQSRRICESLNPSSTIFSTFEARTNFKLSGRKQGGPAAGELSELRINGNGCRMPLEETEDEGWFLE